MRIEMNWVSRKDNQAMLAIHKELVSMDDKQRQTKLRTAQQTKDWFTVAVILDLELGRK